MPLAASTKVSAGLSVSRGEIETFLFDEAALLDEWRLEEWRAAGRLATVKTGPQRTVYRADLSEGAVYVKHFRVPGWRAKLRQWVRREPQFRGSGGAPAGPPVSSPSSPADRQRSMERRQQHDEKLDQEERERPDKSLFGAS